VGDVRALSLWQPWASLIALGIKTIETRSWKAPASAIGQPLLIHAAKRKPDANTRMGDFMLLRHGDHTWRLHNDDQSEYDQHDSSVPLSRCRSCAPLVFGAVVASCVVTGCVPILGCGERLDEAWARHVAPTTHGELWVWNGPSDTENASTGRPTWLHDDVTDQLPFGDFSPGRYAWMLDDVKPTTERCPQCWGDPSFRNYIVDEHHPHASHHAFALCPTCEGAGKCEPVSMRGRQSLFTPMWGA
jgi:ASCH domain